MGMSFTPADLEYQLVKLIKTATADMIFKNPLDHKGRYAPVPLSVYQGHIPSYQAGPRGGSTLPKAPACAIKTTTFHYRRLDGVCTIRFLIVTWDDDLSRRGYIDVLNIMNRIINALEETVIIGKSFVLTDDPIHAELLEDPAADYHPHYLGDIHANFGLMTPSPGWIPPFDASDVAPYGDVGPDTLQIVAPESLPT